MKNIFKSIIATLGFVAACVLVVVHINGAPKKVPVAPETSRSIDLPKTIPLFISTPSGIVVTYVTPNGKDEVCFKTFGDSRNVITCMSKGQAITEDYFRVDTQEYVETNL